MNLIPEINIDDNNVNNNLAKMRKENEITEGIKKKHGTCNQCKIF